MALGTIAVYYSLAIGYYYIEEYRKAGEEKLNAFTGSILSLFAFLMTIPSIIWKNGAAVGVSTKVVENTGSVNGLALANGWITRFGGVGIFISIIMGILAVQVYRFCVNRDLTIKMPEGVPAGVSRSFASLIPLVLVAFIVIIIVSILGFLGTDIHALLSAPFGFVKYLTGSWLGMVIILLLIHLLWIVGVHGTAIIKNSFINPILLVALTDQHVGLPWGRWWHLRPGSLDELRCQIQTA